MSAFARFAPFTLFAMVVAIGYAGFYLADPHQLPSALIGKPFPDFSAPRLDDGRVVTRANLIGKPMLVNVWATWCPTCAAEHAELMTIAERTGLPIVGINYKDDPAKARRWLAQYGDPYVLNLVDANGLIGVELGVYGAPESFLVDAEGTIVYKRVGEITPRIWQDEIVPHLEQWEVALR
jgi:cytochrome c biogenesis protein CcmG/thiol:disulfide interchange protein DsbE